MRSRTHASRRSIREHALARQQTIRSPAGDQDRMLQRSARGVRRTDRPPFTGMLEQSRTYLGMHCRRSRSTRRQAGPWGRAWSVDLFAERPEFGASASSRFHADRSSLLSAMATTHRSCRGRHSQRLRRAGRSSSPTLLRPVPFPKGPQPIGFAAGGEQLDERSPSSETRRQRTGGLGKRESVPRPDSVATQSKVGTLQRSDRGVDDADHQPAAVPSWRRPPCPAPGQG